jgi:hypothetical protein
MNVSHCRSSPSDACTLLQVPQERGFNLVHPQSHNCSDPHVKVTSTIRVEKKSKDTVVNNDEAGTLKKLDSFGRWMDKEIGGDCHESLMASDSGNYWNALDAENDEKEVSSLSRHMHLDTDLLGPSLSQEQLFTIRDFSPDWAYSGDTTEDATKYSRKVCILWFATLFFPHSKNHVDMLMAFSC